MHMVQFICFWGHLQEQQKAEGKCHIEFEHHSNSHVCAFVSDVSITINHDLTPQKTPVSPHYKYRGERRRRDDKIYCWNFLFSFFFIYQSGKNRRDRDSRRSSELNAFFKVALNFVQNPPRGLPLLKAISSQNECASTIGLALISIHLSCLCVEMTGAAAGGVGV